MHPSRRHLAPHAPNIIIVYAALHGLSFDDALAELARLAGCLPDPVQRKAVSAP